MTNMRSLMNLVESVNETFSDEPGTVYPADPVDTAAGSQRQGNVFQRHPVATGLGAGAAAAAAAATAAAFGDDLGVFGDDGVDGFDHSYDDAIASPQYERNIEDSYEASSSNLGVPYEGGYDIEDEQQ